MIASRLRRALPRRGKKTFPREKPARERLFFRKRERASSYLRRRREATFRDRRGNDADALHALPDIRTAFKHEADGGKLGVAVERVRPGIRAGGNRQRVVPGGGRRQRQRVGQFSIGNRATRNRRAFSNLRHIPTCVLERIPRRRARQHVGVDAPRVKPGIVVVGRADDDGIIRPDQRELERRVIISLRRRVGDGIASVDSEIDRRAEVMRDLRLRPSPAGRQTERAVDDGVCAVISALRFRLRPAGSLSRGPAAVAREINVNERHVRIGERRACGEKRRDCDIFLHDDILCCLGIKR